MKFEINEQDISREKILNQINYYKIQIEKCENSLLIIKRKINSCNPSCKIAIIDYFLGLIVVDINWEFIKKTVETQIDCFNELKAVAEKKLVL